MRGVPSWLTAYSRGAAMQDSIAGIVVTLLLVPQSLAYALLAGVPPHVGMYATILPLLAYAVFGSSMTLSVGPVAVASLMTAAALTPLAVPGSSEYGLLAMLLALMGGIALMIFGVLRMGFVANFLSHPVISGFVTGSAILIALGQCKLLLGVPAQGETALQLLASLMDHAPGLHVPTVILGGAALLLLALVRSRLAWLLGSLNVDRRTADIAGKLAPMVVLLLSILLVVALDLDERFGVVVVGHIPAGLPSWHLALPKLEHVQALLMPALVIAIIGFVESVAVAQSLAARRRERIDADAELRGLGVANMASALSGGFPVAGGFSRSVVNFAAGARSPMSGVVSALLMALVLIGMTSLFERLPLAVLAATIVLAVLGLVDLQTPRHAWRADRADAVAWVVTAAGVLALGVVVGVSIGVATSIVTLFWRISRPHIAVVGRVAGTRNFRNEKRFQVDTDPQVLMVRIHERLVFANVQTVLLRIEDELSLRAEVRHVVLDFSSVGDVDFTALEALERFDGELRLRLIELHLAEVRGPVRDRLRSTQWGSAVAGAHFLSLEEAAHRCGELQQN